MSKVGKFIKKDRKAKKDRQDFEKRKYVNPPLTRSHPLPPPTHTCACIGCRGGFLDFEDAQRCRVFRGTKVRDTTPLRA